MTRQEKNRIISKNNYRRKHPGGKRYAEFYKITTPTGEVKQFRSMKEVSVYFGYATSTLWHNFRKSEFHGYILERVY